MFLGVCDEILINLSPFGVFPTAPIAHEKCQDPYISPKKNSSDYRVHGTQNNWLEARVSMQKEVLTKIIVNIIAGIPDSAHMIKNSPKPYESTMKPDELEINLEGKVPNKNKPAY